MYHAQAALDVPAQQPRAAPSFCTRPSKASAMRPMRPATQCSTAHLIGYGGERDCLVLNGQPLLRLDSLVQAIAPASPRHRAPRELVHDNHLPCAPWQMLSKVPVHPSQYTMPMPPKTLRIAVQGLSLKTRLYDVEQTDISQESESVQLVDLQTRPLPCSRLTGIPFDHCAMHTQTAWVCRQNVFPDAHLFAADDVVDVALLQLLRLERIDQVRCPLRPWVVQVRLLSRGAPTNVRLPDCVASSMHHGK